MLAEQILFDIWIAPMRVLYAENFEICCARAFLCEDLQKRLLAAADGRLSDTIGVRDPRFHAFLPLWVRLQGINQ
jgi:hypothetical protein